MAPGSPRELPGAHSLIHRNSQGLLRAQHFRITNILNYQLENFLAVVQFRKRGGRGALSRNLDFSLLEPFGGTKK